MQTLNCLAIVYHTTLGPFKYDSFTCGLRPIYVISNPYSWKHDDNFGIVLKKPVLLGWTKPSFTIFVMRVVRYHQNTTQIWNQSFCNRTKSFWCMVQPLENMVVMQYIRHQRMYLYSPENTTQNFSQDDQKSKIIELPSNVTFWDAHVIFWRSFFSRRADISLLSHNLVQICLKRTFQFKPVQAAA